MPINIKIMLPKWHRN